MFRLKSAAAVALIMAVGACTGDAGSPTAPEVEPQTTISDAAHAGAVPGFYFLPPMVSSPSYSGTFDAGVQPTVEICELNVAGCTTTIALYTTTSGTGGQTVQVGSSSYQVNWNTSQFNLDPAKHYRISVSVNGFLLGFADVDVVSSGKELKNVDTQQYIPLQDDRTLPIKFRIETGIVGQVIVSPDSADIPVGGTQQFTATALDLHGNPIACAPTSWSSSNPAVATVNGSGLATGVAPGSTVITATCQAASGSAFLTVFNPNTPPVAVPDTFEAIGNVTVPVSAPGVLANDTDGENNTLQAVPGTFATAGGGTVTINADGSFTYLSAAGFVGADSFTYDVSDGQATATGTVTVTSAYRVWYVDNADAGPGDGRDASPFSTLAGAEAASTAGETVFVRTGSAPYDGGFVLKTGQSLTGQGVPSNVTATLNGETVVLLAAGSAPTITKASGATIQLATNNVVQGVDVTSAAGAGISGSGFGTLTVGSVSVNATGGPALDLSSGDVSGSFDVLSSSGSTGAGIHLVGVGGSFSAAAGSITGSSGPGVEVIGGAGAFSYGGNMAVAGPLAVSVTGRTGGALTFSGTIASTGQGISVQNNSGGTVAFTGSSKSLSTGANAGVSLANNTGATISFGGGGLVIATTSGNGFSATGGGTLSVTGAGNTVTSAGGAAVRVVSTTIGSAGLTFQSVSASGGTNGIVLNNTGAVNGLQVTGSGAAGSGGTIQGMSGQGVRLDNARSVSLASMVIQNNAGGGIGGAGVTGFGLDGVLVSGNGISTAHAGVVFDGLFGASTITGSTITGSSGDNAVIRNNSGSMSLAVTGSTISNTAAGGNDGLRVEASSGAVMDVSVSGSTFAANAGDHFQGLATGSAGLTVGFTGNTLSGGHASPLGQGILIGTAGSLPGFTGSVSFDIANNSINGAVSTAVVLNLGLSTAAASFGGTVTGNQIGTSGVALSCSTQGSGVSLESRGNGVYTAAVTGNVIRRCLDRGINVLANDGAGTMNLTVTGNTATELVNASSREGFFLNNGSTSLNTYGQQDSHTVCLDLSGNTFAQGPSAIAAIRLRQRFATTVRLPGYAGANTDVIAVAAFLSANNGGATANAQATVPPGGGYVGGAGCPQP